MVTTFSRQNEAARHVSSTYYVDSTIQRLNNRGLLDSDLIIRWLALSKVWTIGARRLGLLAPLFSGNKTWGLGYHMRVQGGVHMRGNAQKVLVRLNVPSSKKVQLKLQPRRKTSFFARVPVSLLPWFFYSLSPAIKVLLKSFTPTEPSTQKCWVCMHLENSWKANCSTGVRFWSSISPWFF